MNVSFDVLWTIAFLSKWQNTTNFNCFGYIFHLSLILSNQSYIFPIWFHFDLVFENKNENISNYIQFLTLKTETNQTVVVFSCNMIQEKVLGWWINGEPFKIN